MAKEIAPEEILPVKEKLFVEDVGEELEWNLDEEIGEYSDKEVKIDRVIMKELAKRSTSVRILRFLLKRKERDFSCKEVYTILKMPAMTVNYALRKLVSAGVLEPVVPFAVDKRNKYYRIVNSKVVEAIIRLHDRFASFKLARLLPLSIHTYVTIDELRKKPKFLELCAKYKLSADEGIEALKSNTRKVEPVYSEGYRSKGELRGFRRKEQ